MITYISVGNSDDKLSQKQWAQMCDRISVALLGLETHGQWFSLPNTRFQNACWCVEVPHTSRNELLAELKQIREEFVQDSIAWAETPDTLFI